MRAIKFQGRLWALLPEGGHSIQGEIVEVVDAKDKSPACGKVRDILQKIDDLTNPKIVRKIKRFRLINELVKEALATHPQEPLPSDSEIVKKLESMKNDNTVTVGSSEGAREYLRSLIQEPLPWEEIDCPDCGGCGTNCNGAEYEKPCRGLCKGAGKLYINRKDILSRFPERGGE